MAENHATRSRRRFRAGPLEIVIVGVPPLPEFSRDEPLLAAPEAAPGERAPVVAAPPVEPPAATLDEPPTAPAPVAANVIPLTVVQPHNLPNAPALFLRRPRFGMRAGSPRFLPDAKPDHL